MDDFQRELMIEAIKDKSTTIDTPTIKKFCDEELQQLGRNKYKADPYTLSLRRLAINAGLLNHPFIRWVSIAEDFGLINKD